MHFVIAGFVTSLQFDYAILTAQKLEENLPDFRYKKICLSETEWPHWLDTLCQEEDWYHVACPLIWRELSMSGGKKQYVGDTNAFLQLCRMLYGVPRYSNGEELDRHEMNWYRDKIKSELKDLKKRKIEIMNDFKPRHVCLTGAATSSGVRLIMELIQTEMNHNRGGLQIRLYDDPKHRSFLRSVAQDCCYCQGHSGLQNCRVATSLKDALSGVDMVIILDVFRRKKNEYLAKWLKRNRNAMFALGKCINKYVEKNCRVVISSPSSEPACYNATVLASAAVNLDVRNIVVVTQDMGLETLRFLSQKCKTPLQDLSCPPVWGFTGLNKYVDVRNTLQNFVYKTPSKKLNEGEEREHIELRTLGYMIKETDRQELWKNISQNKYNIWGQKTKYSPLCKIKATIDLLKVWGGDGEDGNGEILSLGVYSDGTFNISEGLYWSQPVTLEKGFWRPFPDYPIPRYDDINLYYLVTMSVCVCQRTDVTVRISPVEKIENERNCETFDFNQIEEEIDMPVIRTVEECLAYLKYLSMKELDIVLNEDQFMIPEVDEEVEEKEESCDMMPDLEDDDMLWCQCWRAKLKQLQQVDFVHSSTTEVEVDLSDQFSGPEWPVINPNREISDMNLNSSRSGEGSSSSSGSIVCTCIIPSGEPGCRCAEIEKQKREEERKKRKAKRAKKREAGKNKDVVCYCKVPKGEKGCTCFDESSSEEKSETLPIIEEETAYEMGLEEEEKEEDVRFYQETEAETEAGALQALFTKEVRFADEDISKPEKKKYPLYGTQDAIKDYSKIGQMQRRIRKYECDGVGFEEEEEEEERTVDDEEDEREGEITKESDEASFDDEEAMNDIRRETKYHVSIENAPFEVVGDQEGLESLEENRLEKSNRRDENFTEMWLDKLNTELHPPTESETTETASSSTSTTTTTPCQDTCQTKEPTAEIQHELEFVEIPGEDFNFEEASVREEDQAKEQKIEEESIKTEDKEMDEEREEGKEPKIKEESIKTEEGKQIDEEREPNVDGRRKRRKRKRGKFEGVPSCYICRCIIPEGELGCWCQEGIEGEELIMEQWVPVEEIQPEEESQTSSNVELSEETRKEDESSSVEKTVESFEETETEMFTSELILNIERPESLYSDSTKSDEISDDDFCPEDCERDIFNLPPESFIPFSPKLENKFNISVRPVEMTRTYLEQMESETDFAKGVPDQCLKEIRLIEEQWKNNEMEFETEESIGIKGKCGKKFSKFNFLNQLNKYQDDDKVEDKSRKETYDTSHIKTDCYYD